jgi:hypothetical protein
MLIAASQQESYFEFKITLKWHTNKIDMDLDNMDDLEYNLDNYEFPDNTFNLQIVKNEKKEKITFTITEYITNTIIYKYEYTNTKELSNNISKCEFFITDLSNATLIILTDLFYEYNNPSMNNINLIYFEFEFDLDHEWKMLNFYLMVKEQSTSSNKITDIFNYIPDEKTISLGNFKEIRNDFLQKIKNQEKNVSQIINLRQKFFTTIFDELNVLKSPTFTIHSNYYLKLMSQRLAREQFKDKQKRERISFLQKQFEKLPPIDKSSSQKGGSVVSSDILTEMTVKELQERCKTRKIPYSGKKKEELIKALRRKR